MEEQCDLVEKESEPRDDDDDSDEGGVPVKLKDPKKVGSDSMQTPHDPDVTYSGHKGKGYEVQVTETCDPENDTQIITDVAVTDSCDGDAGATIPILESLIERDIQPDELSADTSYGSGENAVEAACLGTELISPVGGSAKPSEEKPKSDSLLTAADFDIDPGYRRPTKCPNGHESVREEQNPDVKKKVEITFAKEVCEGCADFERCPAKLNQEKNGYVLKADLVKVNIERRRRVEASGDFTPRYNIRAGIEATNSELKRPHGLGRLRIRGRPRVELAVYLKTLACNVKRMVRALTPKNLESVPAAV